MAALKISTTYDAFAFLVKKKDYKKKDAAQAPQRLGEPKPKCQMASRILCGSERLVALPGPSGTLIRRDRVSPKNRYYDSGTESTGRVP